MLLFSLKSKLDYNRNKFHLCFTESRVKSKFLKIGLLFLSFWPKTWLYVLPLCQYKILWKTWMVTAVVLLIFSAFPNFSKMDKLSYRISYLLHSTWEGTCWKSFRTVPLAILITAYLLSCLDIISVLLPEFTDLHKEAVLL